MDITYEQFKKEIFKRTGINLNNYKEKQMKRRIESYIRRNNKETYKDYLELLDKNPQLKQSFLDYITINVSEFFRNPTQWKVLEENILPALFAAEPSKMIKIWSAACSTGEEPYSLAMIMSKHLPLDKINILATDIDTSALNKAKEGVYNIKSINNVPKEFIGKFFTINGDIVSIDEKLKKTVDFKKLDLLSDPYPSPCDLIVCRNVMIYFTEETKINLYKKFRDALKGHGILFVGSTEQIILSQRYGFSPVKTFFYKKIS